MRLPTLDTVWVALPLVGVLIAASVEPLPPYDFWWHLVMGRMLAAGQFPDANYFLYTLPADAPFHDQPWLAQWIMYQVHELGGLVGGMFLRSGLLLAAWGLLTWGAVKRAGPRIGGFVALAAAVVSYPVLTYRTRVFAFVPFIVLLLVLLEERRTHRGVVAIGLATAFWASVHGTFVLAPLLVFGSAGAFFLGKVSKGELRQIPAAIWRWWGGAFAAAVLGAFATPHGVDNFAYVANLAVTSNVSSTVSEWLPPDLSTGIGLAWGVSFFAVLLVLSWRRRHVPVLEAALLLATTYLAASAIRSVFWWAATAALVVAPHLRELAVMLPGSDSTERDDEGGNVLNLAILATLVGALVMIHPGTAPQTVRMELGGGRFLQGGSGVLSNENSVEDVERALQSVDDGVIFHDQALGGLIEWMATSGSQPRPVAFVDQRMELIPEDVWDAYFDVSSSLGWREVFEEYDVEAAILAPEGQWPLIQALDESPDWRLVRVGQAHVVYVRNGRVDRK